jgi:predicted metal-dependent hydrolase
MQLGYELIFLLCLISIGIFYYINKDYYEGLTNIKSTIDNREYIVQQRDDAIEAANLIAMIRKKLEIIVKHLIKITPDDDYRVAMLKENFRPDNLKEGVDKPGYTSYSINKGEEIVLCLRTNNKMVDLNTMMFVVLHELAHIATKSIGHTEEFWDNFKWILEEAINIGIYIKQDFKKEAVEYCGMTITSSPLD